MTTQSLKRVPPGLSRGLRFEDDEETFDPIEGSPQSDQEVEPEVRFPDMTCYGC